MICHHSKVTFPLKGMRNGECGEGRVISSELGALSRLESQQLLGKEVRSPGLPVTLANS